MKPSELDRIRAVYAERQNPAAAARYGHDQPGERYTLARRRAEFGTMLKRHFPGGLGGLRILDIGCGRGERLAECCGWGADPDTLVGIDLMESLIGEARRSFPACHWLLASGHDLPLQNESFDLVMQAMTFSSILCPEMRSRMVAEMWRVLRPGGAILWYDMRCPNPRNPHIRAIGRRELTALFPVPPSEIQSLTLLPPLARRLAPYSQSLCRQLERLPWLRTHYLALIRKAVL
jgi:SAM-dependent methyltransferase